MTTAETPHAPPPKAEPLVGIVTTVWDGGTYLRATLESMLEQRYEHWRCVVVDDGSTDDSGAIADEFAARDARFCVVHQGNRGLPVSRNVGYHAVGAVQYVAFMDADDVWTADALSLLVSAAERLDAVGAHGLAEFIDADGRSIGEGRFSRLGRERRLSGWGRTREDFTSPSTTFAHLVTSSTIFPPGVFLARASEVAEIGLFDPRVPKANDWDFLIRLARRGKLEFVDEVILHYRRHQTNMGAGPGVREATALVRRKAFHSPENDATQRSTVRKAWRAAQTTSARGHRDRLRSQLERRDVVGVVGTAARLGLAAGRFAVGRPLNPTRELGR